MEPGIEKNLHTGSFILVANFYVQFLKNSDINDIEFC